MGFDAVARRSPALQHQEADWETRFARVFADLRGPAAAMVRRAYGPALSEEEIEDVYSSAWLGALKAQGPQLASMSDEELRKYILTAVAHQGSKEIRRRRRRPVTPLENADALESETATPDEITARKERSQITRDLLASLPRRRRAVLLLRYGWGLEPSQVCELIEGLSPRAYRREITRGIDQLCERMRAFEAGRWCADREPILKAFAAGIADAEQQRQAEHHLSHCRNCAEFVGKLSGHLHDIGSAAVVPAALDSVLGGPLSLSERFGRWADRARDSLGDLLSRTPAADSVAGSPAAVPRGTGAAGAGVLAKVAGLGAAGKTVVACLGGGAAAAVCVAAGVGLIDIVGSDADGPVVLKPGSAAPGPDRIAATVPDPALELGRPAGRSPGGEPSPPPAPAPTSPPEPRFPATAAGHSIATPASAEDGWRPGDRQSSVQGRRAGDRTGFTEGAIVVDRVVERNGLERDGLPSQCCVDRGTGGVVAPEGASGP